MYICRITRKLQIVLTALASPLFVMAQGEDLAKNLETSIEIQAGLADGTTPLWLNANKYGLSSLDKFNGYVRANAVRNASSDEGREWKWGYGLDMAVAANHTSTIVVQQAFAELGWKYGLLTIGSKEQPMELKNSQLSSGSQTMGINARPVPQIRLSLPEYWTIPALGRWFHLKGHIAYGRYTDDNWQKDFTAKKHSYTVNTLLHSKAGYVKIGSPDHFSEWSLELGLEMACQFGGINYAPDVNGIIQKSTAGSNIRSFFHAFVPAGQDEADGKYANVEGNHTGSWVARLKYDNDTWNAAVYMDHYFEDHSGMFLLDYNGYGTGDEWNSRKKNVYYKYPLKDIMLGAEVNFPRGTWVKSAVVEYLYTKYQSGPYNHDRTRNISDHLAGCDEYYNHLFYNSWQHWGQVMGNPLYRSPLYNDTGMIEVENTRFIAYHFGLSGSPTPKLNYRLLATYQKGWGRYSNPYTRKRHNVSTMLELAYRPTANWHIKGALGMDFGSILGENKGLQITVTRTNLHL